ncbi:MAG: hypothetical protein ORN49_07485 [Rhodobacteraceae bacterium]|nr:hypothetical protein [Paracoccaceae bacterium]
MEKKLVIAVVLAGIRGFYHLPMGNAGRTGAGHGNFLKLRSSLILPIH